MCLAIPGKIVSNEVHNGIRLGRVQFGGVTRETCLDFVPEASVGDYVIVHVGFAISRVDRELEEDAIPIPEEVRGACELLGLDLLYVANEGKLLAIVEHTAAERVLEAIRQHPLGGNAHIIGTVTDSHSAMVTLRTR
jgi:hydrogenase assembly chaperone HypC/HupF